MGESVQTLMWRPDVKGGLAPTLEYRDDPHWRERQEQDRQRQNRENTEILVEQFREAQKLSDPITVFRLSPRLGRWLSWLGWAVPMSVNIPCGGLFLGPLLLAKREK